VLVKPSPSSSLTLRPEMPSTTTSRCVSMTELLVLEIA
jgi:hypothetical protein